MSTLKNSTVPFSCTPLSIVRMFWKHLPKVLLLATALSGITVFVVSRLPAIYRAETVILVDSQKVPERYVASAVNGDLQDRLATINQRILSSTRLQKLIDTFDLYRPQRGKLYQEEIVELMRSDISVKVEKGWSHDKPGAFRIAYEGSNPTVAAEVANQIGNLYIEENLRAREVHAEGTSDFINSQLQQAKKTLDDLEAKVSDYKMRFNGQLPEQGGSLDSALNRLQVQLQGNHEAANRAAQTRVMLETSLSGAKESEALYEKFSRDSPGNSSAVYSSDPIYGSSQAKPRKRSEALQAELENLLTRYSDTYPDVVNLKASIARAKEKERSEARLEEQQTALQTLRPASTSSKRAATPSGSSPALGAQRQRSAELQTSLMLVRKEIDDLAAEKQRILAQISSYQSRVEKLPLREQDMASLTRDYEISKANYRSLLDKKLSAEMATDLERRQQSENFTILDAARPPERPIKPNRPLWIGVGVMLSLLSGVAFGSALEFRSNAFLGEWEVPAGLTILGRVPRIGLPDVPPSRVPAWWAGKWRMALLTSTCFGLLAVAATLYFRWGRL